MIDLDIESILDQLTRMNYQFHFQKATGQICVNLPFMDGTLPLFIRIYDTADLVQLMLILPVVLKKEALLTLSRLLHILNKEIDLPGFGLDEETNAVFYRVTYPAFENEIHPDLLNTMLISIENIAKQCVPVIAATVEGTLDLDQIFEQFEKMKTPVEAMV